jgi:PST family polysaccharide transporter
VAGEHFAGIEDHASKNKSAPAKKIADLVSRRDTVPAIADEQSSTSPAETQPEQTYGQILKSSAIVGGSTIINVGIGIVRTKIMALLLGPAGFGLAGLYTSIITLTQSLAGMGINSSGVRQIAEAAGSGDQDRIAKTASVLRRTSVVLGLLGGVLLVLFSKQVSVLTFGDAKQRGAVCLISLAVFFQLISGGQGALIQGMRKITDLAKINVIGAFSGLAISAPVVYLLREKGIAVALVLVAATTIITSWWYSRKIRITAMPLTYGEIRLEVAGLLTLGVAFMVSGLMVPCVAYFVRVFLLRQLGIAAAGMYQSAWTLGGLYVGLILQAMGADFYPRLSAVAKDNGECNRLVNEQTLIGLLVAGPGVLATLTLAPLVISLFYSAKFGGAVPVLRWISLGATLQVVTWPMGFIIVAKARQNLFLVSEILWAILATGLAWTCITLWGLNGSGIAFFLAYVAHWIIVYPIVRHLSGFRLSLENRQIGLIILSLIAIVFSGFYFMPLYWAASVGILAAALCSLYSFRVLAKIMPMHEIPRPIRQLLIRLGFVSSDTAPAN